MISVCTPARPKILNPCLPPPPRQNTQRESSSSFMFHVYRPVIVDDDRYDTNSVERVRKKNKKQKKDIIENIALLPCGERNVHARVCVFPRRFRIFREHQHRRKISRENGHIYIYIYVYVYVLGNVRSRAKRENSAEFPRTESGTRNSSIRAEKTGTSQDIPEMFFFVPYQRKFYRAAWQPYDRGSREIETQRTLAESRKPPLPLSRATG